MRCTRCSYCKWIPFDLVQSHRFAKGCPSVEAGKFHAYSAGGKLITALVPHGRAQRGDRPGRRRRLPLPALRQLRRDLQALPLRHGADPRAARAARPPGGDGPRARVLPAADRAHAGGPRRAGPGDPRRPQRLGRGPRPRRPGRPSPSTSSSTPAAGTRSRRACARPCAPRSRLLQHAGLSVGLFENGCCGGLADKMGYRDEAAEAGGRMLAQWAAAGVKTVVTPCADCRHVFTRLYPDLEGARGACPRCCTRSSSPTAWSRTGASS